MSFMDFLHSRAELQHKKNETRLRTNESAAKVQHIGAETRRVDSQADLEHRRFDHEVNKFRADTFFRYRDQQVSEALLNHLVCTGADVIEYKGLRGEYRRAQADGAKGNTPVLAQTFQQPTQEFVISQ